MYIYIYIYIYIYKLNFILVTLPCHIYSVKIFKFIKKKFQK